MKFTQKIKMFATALTLFGTLLLLGLPFITNVWTELATLKDAYAYGIISTFLVGLALWGFISIWRKNSE